MLLVVVYSYSYKINCITVTRYGQDNTPYSSTVCDRDTRRIDLIGDRIL